MWLLYFIISLFCKLIETGLSIEMEAYLPSSRLSVANHQVTIINHINFSLSFKLSDRSLLIPVWLSQFLCILLSANWQIVCRKDLLVLLAIHQGVSVQCCSVAMVTVAFALKQKFLCPFLYYMRSLKNYFMLS